jgi:hypothetical protein
MPFTSASVRRCAALIVVALCFGTASAQTTSSSLTGAVRTHEGTPVPDVIVRMRSEETGAVRTAITDASGRYRFGLLEPGSWRVWAQVPDGPVSGARTITLRLRQTIIQDFTVGPVLRETVTVTAEAPLVDRKRTGGELRIDGAHAAELPISGRVVTDLAMLDSSIMATAPGNFFGERGSVFTVNGQSGRSNTFLVDGFDNNDQVSNTTMNSYLSQLVIREFVVETRQYAPEFGRASGGILNIITERGSNEPSGDFIAQGVPGALSESGDFVASISSPDGLDDTGERFQAGFRLEGPFRSDRAFYFLAYEHLEADDLVSYAGVDRNGTPGGWVIAPNRDDNLFFRSDFNLGASQLMVKLSLDDRETNELNVGGRFTPEAGFKIEERDFQISTSLSSVISPSLLNEVRVLYGISSFDQFANSDRPGVGRLSGTFGGNYLNRQIRDESRVQLVENLTWQLGKHTAKAGIDILRSHTKIRVRFNPNGNFIYDSDIPYEPGDCGDLVASDVDWDDLFKPIPCPGDPNVDDDGDGLIDEPGIIGTYPFVWSLIQGKPEVTLEDTRYGLFVQDAWQISPAFLLEYGLRYDLGTFTLGNDARVDSHIPNGGAGRDTDNLAPRLGFAYAPGGGDRFLLRGGAGVFYDKLVLAFPSLAAIDSGTAIRMIFPQGLTFEITEDLVEEYGIELAKLALQSLPSLEMRFSTGTELETPYTVQYSLGAEQAVGSRGAFDVTVTRALGYNLPLMKDLNPVVDPQPGSTPDHPLDPNTGSIATIVTEGRSWYTALDLGWRWRGEKSWYRAGYTWSKALDLGPDPLMGGIYLPPHSDTLEGERGRSDSDRRHRFVLSGATGLPWWGLRVAGVVQVASGLPFNVTTGLDNNQDGILSDRPVGVGRNTGASTDLDEINDLRRDAVREGRVAQLSEIDDLQEPSFSQVDLKISRPFSAWGGRSTGEFFLQVFNLFDRFNGGPIDGATISSDFGESIGQIGPPRTIELGFRVGFNPAPPVRPGDPTSPLTPLEAPTPRESTETEERG